MTTFSTLFDDNVKELLDAKGAERMERLGDEAIRDIIVDVLSGRNVRNSTEFLLRRRLSIINVALVETFMRGLGDNTNFVRDLLFESVDKRKKQSLSKHDRWLNNWVLGLTDKGVQNILRDDRSQLDDYAQEYIEVCQRVADEAEDNYGSAPGELTLPDQDTFDADWLFWIYLLNIAGSTALTVRGSAKSTYGKLFEKLILGSLLHVNDFTLTDREDPSAEHGVFWFKDSSEGRESDASVLVAPNRAARFDIGFIGRGNPEISLDKVSRFRRHVEIFGERWYVKSIILVDRVGKNSGIQDLAEEVDAVIVEMSKEGWPLKVTQVLEEACDVSLPLSTSGHKNLEDELRRRIQDAPLTQFIGAAQN